MGVSVGTGGYRSGYVSSLIPIGESTTLGVAVSQTDFGKHGGGWYGYGGYGGGYGYGGYGDGFTDGAAASQSVALSLMRGGGGGTSPTRRTAAPPASATATAMSNRLWVDADARRPSLRRRDSRRPLLIGLRLRRIASGRAIGLFADT
jgi:hypothetical protein